MGRGIEYVKLSEQTLNSSEGFRVSFVYTMEIHAVSFATMQ